MKNIEPLDTYLTEEKDDRYSLSVKIDNLKDYQVKAIKYMLTVLDMLGSYGASRTVKLYVDGDGAFRPKIEIDGKKVKFESEEQKDKFNKEIDGDTVEIGFE